VADFAALEDALQVPVPTDRPAIEAWSKVTRGFGLRVMASGKRTWIVRYTGTKKNQKANLTPPVDNNEDNFKKARREAEDVRDRAARERAGIGAQSLQEAYDFYVQMKGKMLRAGARTTYDKAFARIPEEMRKKLMDRISDRDWSRWYLSVTTKERTSSAKQSLKLVNVLYKRAVVKGHIMLNPIASIAQDVALWEKSKPRQDHIRAVDLPKVWAATELLPPASRDYLRVILFTSVRRSLAGSLAWDRVNVHDRTYRFEGADVGNKNDKDVFYPISNILWRLVFEPRLALKKPGDKWILPSTKQGNKPLRDPPTAYRFIESKTQLVVGKADVTPGKKGNRLGPHVIRKTVATMARACLGWDPVLLGRILMHSPELTRQEEQTNDYIIGQATDFRDGVNRLAEFILGWAEGRIKASAKGASSAAPPVVVPRIGRALEAPASLPEEYPDLRELDEAAVA